MTKRERASNVPVVSIVDDDEGLRNVTSSFVRSLGHTAHAFISAEDFLQSPHLADTSCLICDVQMPNMDGIELQRVLIGQGRSIPIIFITGFPDTAVEARAMKAGAICFLSKPFDGGEMAGYIAEAIEGRGAEPSRS
jgi:FixJ family two-component response regulator